MVEDLKIKIDIIKDNIKESLIKEIAFRLAKDPKNTRKRKIYNKIADIILYL